ncbi:MAG: M15 family metallopeptidase [Patescibacteria group bacterium]
MDAIKRYKIILSLITSLVLTFVITKTIFFAGVPKINKEKINRTIKNTKDSLTIFKNTFAYKMSPKKIDYQQVFSDVPTVDFEMVAIEPTPISTNPFPTIYINPTEPPVPTPTEIILVKATPTIYNRFPTAIPTVKKKPTRTPTSKPEPTAKPINDTLKISNPLDQPYYNPSLAYKCYNTDKFIEVYADGISPVSCYSKVQSFVSSNLTSVSILGKSIQVHKKAYPAFKAVSDALSENSAAKKYKINTIGAYIFRCNVNASTSGKNDLYSEGCVLSAHSFGIAVDINWDENCNGCSSFTMPMEIVDIFESYGFRWGGRYKSVFGSRIDPMHFEYMYDLCKDLK